MHRRLANADNGLTRTKDISTSYVERSNLSIRRGKRRLTRLTNAFSKKIDHHVFMLALYFTFYNFCRIHKTLRVTLAMAAGIDSTLRAMDWIVGMIDAVAARPVRPLRYKQTKQLIRRTPSIPACRWKWRTGAQAEGLMQPTPRS